MAYIGPWSNFHELNLDWILEQLKQLRKDVDDISGYTNPYELAPEMDGIASPGDSNSYARGNHVHPTDTSRAAADDLTQEITDRGDADIALAGDIADVDAKIKLANTAPLMDDSSATAGTSDFMARADHVHPTDTSRASKSEFDTLKATVDNMSGSANPYDSTPEMDGVGSAGVIGAYARGDHVHPSDTSKLDTSGGTITGDLRIQGTLISDQCAAYYRSDSVGWVRFAEVPLVKGTQVHFFIQKKGDATPPEFHDVIMEIEDTTDVQFVEEHSFGSVKYVDKIRYSNAGYVDIHSDQSYDCDIACYILPHGPTLATMEAITIITPTLVADAPAGETIISTYNFHTEVPSIIEIQDINDASGKWHVEKWSNGFCEVFGSKQVSTTISQVGSTTYHRGLYSLTIPVTFTTVEAAVGNSSAQTAWITVNASGNTVSGYVYDVADGSENLTINAEIKGFLS